MSIEIAVETVTPILGEYIVATPGTCNGEPRIAGTRIKVRHIYTWIEADGQNITEVLEQYPHLNRAAIHAALAYYWTHPETIHNAIQYENALVKQLRGSHSSLLTSRISQSNSDE